MTHEILSRRVIYKYSRHTLQNVNVKAHVMLNRQKSILCLIHYAGGEASRLKLVKWCFLVANETETRGGTAYYNFLPYHYGPYSFSLKYEIGRLIHDGLIREISDRRWMLTEAANALVSSIPYKFHREARVVLQKYGKLSETELMDAVYERYGWFAINSLREGQRRIPRPVTVPAVFTVGYEGKSVDGFLNDLIKIGIQAIIDVRHNPVARRYGFHKNTLSTLCNNLMIDYTHIPELGIPSPWRFELNTREDYKRLFDRYEAEILPNRVDAIANVADAIRNKPCALMCMETDPSLCHRSRVATAVSELTALPIVHLRGEMDDFIRNYASPDHRFNLSPSFSLVRGTGMHSRNH